MAREKSCEVCNPLVLRAEQHAWWDGFKRHVLKAEPDIDVATLVKAIAAFRAAQNSLSEALGEFRDESVW